MQYIVGIDPGKRGAVVSLALDGKIDQIIVMPDTGQSLANILELIAYWPDGIKMLYLEKAQAMPGQGISSTFKYGQGYGEILGILYAHKIPHTLVSPRVWTKTMHAGTDSNKTAKERSHEAARRLFPAETFLATKRSNKAHDGIIDALLIAEFGRRQCGG